MSVTDFDGTDGGVERERAAARGSGLRHEAAGLLALAAALGLWVLVLAGIAAPLGEGLARLHAPAPAATPACPVPSGALAVAPRAAGAAVCP